MTELIWDGKYDDQGRKGAPPRIALPFQTVETVNEDLKLEKVELGKDHLVIRTIARDPAKADQDISVPTRRRLRVLPLPYEGRERGGEELPLRGL